jgi:hypothetical protein
VKLISLLLVVTFLMGMPVTQQQDNSIVMAPSLHAVDLDPVLAYDLQHWLDQTRPGGTNIFSIMEYSENKNGIFISLAGIDPATPAPYNWNLEEGNVIWTGTVTRVHGQLQLFSPDQVIAASIVPFASLLNIFLPAAGGGPDVAFPWQGGAKLMYGTRGVHGGGFGFGIGLDFVGGNDLGSNVASDVVYASATGTVTAVCKDDYSAAIKVEGGGTKIAYFHFLLDTAGLEVGTTYARGAPIGRLRPGNFNGGTSGCGWADQQANHYHLHWVVEPASGKYRAEGYQLSTSTQKWTRGNESVSTGQWITGGGGSSGLDDPAGTGGPIVIVPGQGSSGGGASLWDFVIVSINTVYGYFKAWYMPQPMVNADNEQMWLLANNMLKTMIKDANVYLVNDALNIVPLVISYSVMLFLEGIKWLALTVLVVFNLVKDVKGLATTS